MTADVLALGRWALALVLIAGTVFAALVVAAGIAEGRRREARARGQERADLVRLDDLERWYHRASRWRLTITLAGRPVVGPLSLAELESLLTYAGHEEGSLLHPLGDPGGYDGAARYVGPANVDPAVGLDVRYELAAVEPFLELAPELVAEEVELELEEDAPGPGLERFRGEIVYRGRLRDLWRAGTLEQVGMDDDVLVTRPRSSSS